ncbi:MAG: MFS transporter [Acetobacter sp.]|nr:MFS transporter [Bacteroides sp.]MCM1340635.1 MFS transporter [Acetobacter sp.]MCM1433746.1 MFS transporter [Clostridiales bacterium]
MAKGKGIELLSGGLFDKPFMDSKVKTLTVSKKEKILGHLVGPLGLIFVVNTIAALVEKFFTQQAGAMYGVDNVEMIKQMGGKYEVIMTVAKLLAVVMGLFTGWLMQHTKSKQGRMRPWHLIFGFVSIAVGGLIFLFPGTTLGESYWYYFFILLIAYHTVGSSYFYLFRDNIVSISSRSPGEKAQLKFIRQMSWTLISGMIIGMLVNMVVLPLWLEHDINGYATLLIILSIIAIPLLLLEYFYTKERVIEDVAQQVGLENENKIPIIDQIKALLTNKYFVIFFILMTIGGIVDNFKGGNVQYFYIKFLLDGENNPLMFTIYQVVTGIPLGLGAIAIYPLAKKFGIKNTTIAGFSLVLIGSILGWIFADNTAMALVAGFLRQTGMLPNAYITATLLCYAFDSVEHKSGFRLEGLLGVSILTAIQSGIYAPFAGGYESSILKLGFVDAVGVTPNADVIKFMTMAFYLFDIILAVAYLVLLPFMDVEKHLPKINSELKERRKAAVLARGEEWIEPEELERMEQEEAERIHEENRIHDLKEKCKKKGLDFDTENQKYLDKQKAKAEKKAAKVKK